MQFFTGDSSKIFHKIPHPLCKLLEKDCKYYFDEFCLKTFGELKEKLVSAPIIISLDWNIPFKVMCDASGVALGVVLEKKGTKSFTPFTMIVKP